MIRDDEIKRRGCSRLLSAWQLWGNKKKKAAEDFFQVWAGRRAHQRRVSSDAVQHNGDQTAQTTDTNSQSCPRQQERRWSVGSRRGCRKEGRR